MTENSLPRVLFVDDEPLVLSGLRRTVGPGFRIETATSGAEGLQQLQAAGEDPFAVVVSDMRMPAMDGAQFLQQAHLVQPEAVLMILSGQAELSSTVAAVNNAGLFRFLTKPCEPELLRAAVADAARQYQLVRAERQLLDETLSGAVDVLVKILAIANPQAFSRAGRITSLVETAAVQLAVEDAWEVRLAALLSQIGCIAVPEAILEQAQFGAALSPEHRAIYATHPQVARDLVTEIPRLARVADWIGRQPLELPAPVAQQPPRPRGSDEPHDTVVLGEHLLHTAIAFVASLDAGNSPGSTVTLLERGQIPANEANHLRCRRSHRRMAWSGVASSRHNRGRSFSSAAMSSSSACVHRVRSVPLGRYWRSRPLVFSFVGRCHGE